MPAGGLGKAGNSARTDSDPPDAGFVWGRNNTTSAVSRGGVGSVQSGGKAVCRSAAADGRGGLLGDAGEGVVRVAAEGLDGGDAHHDDQGQHARVLDRRRAVFLLQELNELLGDVPHLSLAPLNGGCSD